MPFLYLLILGHLFQLRPRLPGIPTLLKLRLRPFQRRNTIRARHRAVEGERPEPPQMIGTASHLIDAADIPLTAEYAVVQARSLSIPEPSPVGRSLRDIGLVSGSPRWQNLARHFPAGRALVSDKTRLNSERRDPHDLLHRGAAAGAGNSTSSSRKVRHNTPSTLVLSPFASIRHQSNGFPLRRGNFRAYDQPCRSGTTCKATGLTPRPPASWASLSRWPW